MLYTFVARDENDLSVERGEFVTVLNRDDPDWFWVLRHCDGNEGFVPSGFVYPGHVLHSYATTATTNTTTTAVARDTYGSSTIYIIFQLYCIVFIMNFCTIMYKQEPEFQDSSYKGKFYDLNSRFPDS